MAQFFPSLLTIVGEFFPRGIFPGKNFPVLNPPPPLYQGKWKTLPAARRVDELWAFLTWVAEESVLALSKEALMDPGPVDRASPLPRALVEIQRGRGTRRLLKRVTLCPRQRCVSGAAATAPLARLQAALGALRTVIRGSCDAPWGPRVLSVGEERSWWALRKRLDGVAAAGTIDDPGLGRGPADTGPGRAQRAAAPAAAANCNTDPPGREGAARGVAGVASPGVGHAARGGVTLAAGRLLSTPGSWPDRTAPRRRTSVRWTGCCGRPWAPSTANTRRPHNRAQSGRLR